MRRLVFLVTLGVTLGCSAVSQAGLNLGMKLACKRYGDAWNSRNKSAMSGVCTSDFAHQWNRLPSNRFASLPRSGGGRVLSSHKGNGSGTVTVATDQGVVTFRLVGQGLKWTVADIYKPGDDGQTVSVKSYLDLTLTAAEFMDDLRHRGGTSFHDSLSYDFQNSFRSISYTDLNRIRATIPATPGDVKPYVSMHGSNATMNIRVPDGQGGQRHVTFHMVQQGGWKVHDYSVQSNAVKIPSFREGLPLLAAVASFRAFAKDPQNVDPTQFTADNHLREQLAWARFETPCPITLPPRTDEFVVCENHRCAYIRCPDREVKIRVAAHNGRYTLDTIDVKTGERWTKLDGLLAMKRQINEIRETQFAMDSVGGLFKGWSFGGAASQPSPLTSVSAEEMVDTVASAESMTEVAAAEEESTLENVVATVVEPAPAATAQTHRETVIAQAPVVYNEVMPATTFSSQPVEQYRYVQPTQYVVPAPAYQQRVVYRPAQRQVRTRRGLFGRRR